MKQLPDVPSSCREDSFECVCLYFLSPLLIVLGLCGSLTNLIVMRGPGFTDPTFFYLRSLSVTDILYLLSVIILYLAEFAFTKETYDPS